MPISSATTYVRFADIFYVITKDSILAIDAVKSVKCRLIVKEESNYAGFIGQQSGGKVD